MSYPEHDKLRAVAVESQAVGRFLDEGPYVLCRPSPDGRRFDPVHKSIPSILADWFGIDEKQLEAEKRQMLVRMAGVNPPR